MQYPGQALGTSRGWQRQIPWIMDNGNVATAELEPSLAKAQEIVHELAAEALQSAYQCIGQLVPPRFGATELLLGPHEKINAWCYEDGYLTYATDESAAAIMYAETGSLPPEPAGKTE
jgi:hypothetical protein